MHSRMVPVELCANPLPVTDTLCPPVTPELGLTDIVGDAAEATVAVATMTAFALAPTAKGPCLGQDRLLLSRAGQRR